MIVKRCLPLALIVLSGAAACRGMEASGLTAAQDAPGRGGGVVGMWGDHDGWSAVQLDGRVVEVAEEEMQPTALL